MALNVSRLRVSLTKHGILKLAKLVRAYPRNQVLHNTWDSLNSIRIDAAQVRGVMSVSDDGNPPLLWDKIRDLGDQDIEDIVFIAIIFSHHKLIECMIDGNRNDCIIYRGRVIDGKEFTNFAHTIDEFKYSIEHEVDHVSYDISRIYYKSYLVEYVREILRLKLLDAGGTNTIDDLEVGVQLRFNEVFNLSKDEYKEWLKRGSQPSNKSISGVKATRNFKSGIKFKSGHSSKYTGTKSSYTNIKKATITYLHNEIQNELYSILNEEFPNRVGTEIPTNSGSVDLVIQHDDGYSLYEIKTLSNCRLNIRQGLSQILEYAFWKSKFEIKELVIVGPSKATKYDISYLQKLRESFGIPIYFQSLYPGKRQLGPKS